MISYLKGRIAFKGAGSAVLEVGGIGYELLMPASALEVMGSVGDEAKVLVSMQVREDSVSLYGFAAEDEKMVFEKLKTVSGVGPKVALSALSSLGAQQLMKAIATEDNSALSKIPGIGKKTAQRMIVDLKSMFEPMVASDDDLFSEPGSPEPPGTARSDAVAALLAMGFAPEETRVSLAGYAGDDDVQEMIRYALKRLGGF